MTPQHNGLDCTQEPGTKINLLPEAVFINYLSQQQSNQRRLFCFLLTVSADLSITPWREVTTSVESSRVGFSHASPLLMETGPP